MSGTEILGFIAAVFELVGLFLLCRKIKLGFLINILGNLSWIIFSVITNSAYGLLVVCGLALILNCFGFKNWGKK